MELFKRSRIKAHHLLPIRITRMIHFCLIIRIWTPTTLFRNQKLEKEIKCKDNCLSLLILRGLSMVIWWTFLLFLLCNLKNQKKSRIPRRNTGKCMLLLRWSKLECRVSCGLYSYESVTIWAVLSPRDQDILRTTPEGGSSCLGTKTFKTFLGSSAISNPDTDHVADVAQKWNPESQGSIAASWIS